MTFYVLHIPGLQSERLEFIRKACKKLSVGFKALDPFTFDFSKPSPVKKGDIVFRISRGKLLRFFEDYIVQPGITTFYKDSGCRKMDPFSLEKAKIPVPKTIFCADNDHKKLIGYIKSLGGFPVVIKALGGTRGMGVMRIDSFSSLFGVMDFLITNGKAVVMKKFIPVNSSARFIVLGDKVIASLEYKSTHLDFRTNASQKLQVKGKKYLKIYEDLAVKATRALGFEFSGVDILIDKKKAYVTEVNFPCNFVRAQEVLKHDIALEMVRYLVQKARR
jgi:hypothetical protein